MISGRSAGKREEAAPPQRSRPGAGTRRGAKSAQTRRRPPAGRRRPGPLPYLSAPAVSPATTCRWKMMYAASTGSIAIVSPANRPDQSPL